MPMPQDLTHVAPTPVEVSELSDSTEENKKPQYLKNILASLKKIQKYSAYAFLSFFGLHISSTIIAPGIGLNPTRCQDVFEMTRAVYLSPLFEYSAIYGAAAVHLVSGITIRIVRTFETKPHRKVQDDNEFIFKNEHRDDIGLGGLGTILGLGYKKSWISSHVPALTPLTFSGYVMALALGYHVYRMKIGALLIDGDSTLINLNFISHYLKQSSYGNVGSVFNYTMLALLSWVSFYHIVSGLFKFRRQFSLRARKIAYTVISIFSGLSLIAMTRFKSWPLEQGFIGKQFARYMFVTPS